MTSSLDRAVDALSDPEVSLPAALRTLLVVSRRIKAPDLSEWLLGELDGYESGVAVPSYREGTDLSVELRFAGPFGASAKSTMSQKELPKDLRVPREALKLRAPVAELVELSRGERDPGMQLPGMWVGRFRALADERKVAHYEMMQLNDAAVKIPLTHLKGILDRIRTAALELALSLEDVSSQAGASGGPTVADEPRMAQQITVHLTQLYAQDATITVGDHATVASGAGAVAVNLAAGDVDGLLRAARGLVGEDGAGALAVALEEDGGAPGEHTSKFLDRVKQGGVVLVGGLTTNAAYDGLVALLGQVFGG